MKKVENIQIIDVHRSESLILRSAESYVSNGVYLRTDRKEVLLLELDLSNKEVHNWPEMEPNFFDLWRHKTYHLQNSQIFEEVLQRNYANFWFTKFLVQNAFISRSHIDSQYNSRRLLMFGSFCLSFVLITPTALEAKRRLNVF